MAAGRVARAAGAAVALLPAGAQAHTVSASAGAFWGGLLHVVSAPEHLLALVGLGLLLGLGGRAVSDESLVLVVPLALAAGVGIARVAALASPDRYLLVLSLLAVGGLVAAALPIARSWLACLVVGAGGLHGVANGAALPPELSMAAFAAGVALAGFLLVVYAAELARRARAFWARTAVRAVGSWIAATGVLVLGMPR